MARPTVWIRRDPVGAHTRLPSRDEFHARHLRRSLVAGRVSAAALIALLVLRVLPRWDQLWNPLHAVAFCFAIAGIGAAAIALRGRRRRRQAFVGLAVSAVALVGALFIDRLVDFAGG